MSSTINFDFAKDEVIELDLGQVANANDVCKDNSDPSFDTRNQNPRPENIKESCDVIDRKKKRQDSSSIREASSQPLLKVIFRDEDISRRYRKRLKKILEELVSSENMKNEEEEEDSCELVLEIWDNANISANELIDITSESEDNQDVICDSLFVVDTKPKLKDDLDIPTYGKKYDSVFEKRATETLPKDESSPVRRRLGTCFNCLGDHILKDCQEPKDRVVISKNKRNFNANGAGKSLRYHLESDQKFGHMVPGQLSKNLRKALGLRENELPTHIYRMRILGYPPGWLEEARLQSSGLSLFNSDGVAERNLSDAANVKLDSVNKDQYDIKKIYDFPGFNVPPPPGTRDDGRDYWAPEMQAVHSKQTMLLMLQGQNVEEGYKRRKLKLTSTKPMDGTKLIPTEMEIENEDEDTVEPAPTNGLFVPPLPTEPTTTLSSQPQPPPPPPLPVITAAPPQPLMITSAPPLPLMITGGVPPPLMIAATQPPPLVIATAPPPPPVSEYTVCLSQELPSLESPEDSSASPFSRASPSLLDLENMKKRLLVELEETSSQSNPETPLRSNSSNSTTKPGVPPVAKCSTPEMNRSESRNNHNTSQGSVITVDFGTPILQSSSPYNRLPSSEKFSKDICDVINFENLPDSIGKYKKMTKVLQKVRDTLGGLNDE